jgi:dipeptidyl aminopeptidase/acylaminoacyl peptidase
MMTRLVLAMFAALLMAVPHIRAQQGSPALEKLFASAQHKAAVAGDLKGAIEDYKQIVATAGNDRPAAAQALLRMAEAYQKLGDAEGQRIYRRIVKEFADEKPVSAVAASRLREGALTARRAEENAPINRSAWTPPDTVDIHGKISPDGRLLPYRDLGEKPAGMPAGTAPGLFVRDVTTGISRRIVEIPKAADVGGAEYPEGSAFSRDSRRLAYAWRVRKRNIYQLRMVSVEPSPAPSLRVLLDNDDITWLAPYDWTPDGKWIAVVVLRADRTAAIGLVSSQDGSWRQLQSVEWNAVLNVAISPAGDYVAFDRRMQEDGRRDVFVLALDGSRASVVAASAADDALVGWSPDGQRLLFVSDRSGTFGLWSVPVARGAATGHPMLLYPNVGPFWPLGVTTSGAIWSVVMATAGAKVESARLDSDTLLPIAPETLDDFAGPTTTLRWSHQVGQLAWASQWLGVRPMTPVAQELQHLRLSIRAADGVRRLHPPLTYINDFDWAADDRSLIAAGGDQSSRTGIFRIDAATGHTTPLVLTPGEQVDLPPSGPDGSRGVGRPGAITADHIYYRRIRIDCPPGSPSDCVRQTTKLVERNLRSGVERDVLPWAARFWRGRPDRAGAIDVVAIAPDQYVLYLTSHVASEMLSLNVVSLADGSDRELMRTSVADRLVLLAVTGDEKSALVRKDPGGSRESEVWLVATDGSRVPTRLAAPGDIAAFGSIGWSQDRSRLILARRLGGDKSELAMLTLAGDFKRQPLNKDVFWAAMSPDGRRLAYGTAWPAPAAPLTVWVLERAINAAK